MAERAQEKVSGGLHSKKAQSYIDLGRMGNLDMVRCYLYQENVTKKMGSRKRKDTYQYVQKKVSLKNDALAYTRPWVQSPVVHTLSSDT